MGRVRAARKARNEIRRRIRGLTADNELIPPSLRSALAKAEAALARVRRARRARRREAWRAFVDGMGDLLGYADDLLHLDEDTRLGRLATAVVDEAGIPVDDLARGLDLARVILEIAKDPIQGRHDDTEE